MSPLTGVAALPVAALPVAAVDAPFKDARADQLAYSLDHPRIAPLASSSADIALPASRSVSAPALALHVELGVLGTSHQVTVTRYTGDGDTPDGVGEVGYRHAAPCARGRVLVRETLACLPAAAAGPVPRHRRSRLPAGTIDVVHDVHAPTDMGGDVDAALAAASAMGVSCAAGFPGDPHALTILGCDADGDALVWRTWHCYPQAGEIVETRTRFVPETAS